VGKNLTNELKILRYELLLNTERNLVLFVVTKCIFVKGYMCF
jgi:hypothetical protein